MTTTETRAPTLPELQPKPHRRSRLRLFFIVTFVVAYVLWGLVALAAAGVIALPIPTMLVLFVGGLAPALAAIWAVNAESGRPAVWALLRMLVRWRVHPGWYAVALLGPAVVVLSALGLGVAVGSPLPPAPPLSAWPSVAAMFVVFVLLGAIEEIGWRAYALPRLLTRMTPVPTSLLLGMVWGVWHAPQWFIPETAQAGFPFPAFLVWVGALSIMFTWIFNGTRGSVLLVILTHAATNAFQTPWLAGLALVPASERGIDPHLLVLVPQVILSLAIVAVTRGRLGLPDTPGFAKRPARLRSVLAGALGGMVLLGGAGAFAQAMAENHDRRAFPPPGRMVNVGGHRLHLQVMGEEHTGPTVILDAGMASFSTNWHWVQSELASSIRVVAYDRAGLGWSEPGPQPRDARQSATELHLALQGAGIGGPYVVVGHSYGGLVSRVFADLYLDEVAGVVLVDASHPDQWTHIPASMDGRMTALSNRILSSLASVGFLRVLDPVTPQVATGLPPHEYAQMRAILAQPASTGVGADALSVWHTRTRQQVTAARPLGGLPLSVLSVSEQPLFGEVLTALQSELPALSSNGVQRIVTGATHEDLISNATHAAVVADAIRQVVAATGH
jgi:pimeloyl-ACP methyl ester carboxylesterase/membrane protease YdiL (CAAX protease family)